MEGRHPTSTLLVFIDTQITCTIPPVQTSPAALETSCFSASRTTQEPKQGLSPTSLCRCPCSRDPQTLKPPLLVAVQVPALTPNRRWMGAGYTGASWSQSRLTSPFLTFAPDSQSHNPHPHSGLFQGAQSTCFTNSLRLTKNGEREREGFPAGIESLDVGRGQWVQFFFFFWSTTEREKGGGGFLGEEVTGLVLKELVWIRGRVKERFCWLSSPLPAPVKKW